MAIFNNYVKLAEGTPHGYDSWVNLGLLGEQDAPLKIVRRVISRMAAMVLRCDVAAPSVTSER